MKKNISILLLATVLLLPACSPNGWEAELTSAYKPILAKRESLKKTVGYKAERPLCHPGKFYIMGNTIFIVEKYEGIHVFDNSDKTNPQAIGFITILGCQDISMKGTFLYADSAVDLLTIDLSNGIENLKVTHRIENIFPEWLPPDGKVLKSEYLNNRPSGTVVIGWEKI